MPRSTGCSTRPAGGFTGLVEVHAYADDGEEIGDNITVLNYNAPPQNSVPGNQSVAQNGSLAFSTATGNALAVSDPDSQFLNVTLTVSHGTLHVDENDNTYVELNDGPQVILHGGIDGAIADALETLVYTPDAGFSGNDSLELFTDDGYAHDIDNVAIKVYAPNVAPVLTGGTFPLPENSANGTAVATVTSTDANGDAVAYAITGGNAAGAFAIDATTGAITVANVAVLDFEVHPSFTLTITGTDDGIAPLTGTATVTINLTNVDEPPAVAPQLFSIPENSANTALVGVVAATEPDGGQTIVGFQIIGGNTGGAFAIANGGALTVANRAALISKRHRHSR